MSFSSRPSTSTTSVLAKAALAYFDFALARDFELFDLAFDLLGFGALLLFEALALAEDLAFEGDLLALPDSLGA